MSLYIDLTEFLANPITTGIQRIVGEICRYSPPNSLIPIRLDSHGYVAFSPSLVAAIGSYFKDASYSAADEIRRLGAIERGSAINVSQQDTVLVPEVFDNQRRVAFFYQMSECELRRFRFIVYDLLPVTHPEYFIPDNLVDVYGYFRALRRASNCGFISEETREAFYGRLKRTDVRGGVVLPLGCDSLGPRADAVSLDRSPTFSVLGTIEPRKNHRLILEAFEPLLREIKGLNLWFIGKMGWVDSEFAQKIQALSSDENSGFKYYAASGDDTIRSFIEQSRATIYVSTAEGYGLPPVESLWLGTPVIASTAVPSLSRIGSRGIHYVEPLDIGNMRHAILSFLDDSYAHRKAKETAYLNLPTWQSFTQEVFRWCSAEPTQ
ncbi:MAG TPA: glycosyltransferase [Bryobacteraceae bacterium]|jgi:glycosyltransferase involved in cell wall biosynthesis|nr:glycosyltransferase [Bryobacteraceae bacterium]